MRFLLSHAVVWTAAITALIITGLGHAQPSPKAAPKKPTVMQRKLVHAQNLLAALALEDFPKIRASAQGLRDCVKDETWLINDTEKYVGYSEEFLRQTDALQAAAKKKNVDAAALAYVGMTLTCVKCHHHLRDERGEKPNREEDFR